jgi:hypothetical protein
VTRSGARTAANIILGVAGVAAAYVVLTRPPLRRLAVRATQLWLGASVPVYLLQQAGRAWVESDRAA